MWNMTHNRVCRFLPVTPLPVAYRAGIDMDEARARIEARRRPSRATAQLADLEHGAPGMLMSIALPFCAGCRWPRRG